jgi:hypothetical protein
MLRTHPRTLLIACHASDFIPDLISALLLQSSLGARPRQPISEFPRDLEEVVIMQLAEALFVGGGFFTLADWDHGLHFALQEPADDREYRQIPWRARHIDGREGCAAATGSVCGIVGGPPEYDGDQIWR